MKRLLVIGGLLTAVILAGGEAFAQTGTARGKVVDEAGNAIEGAKVILDFQGGVTRHYETKTNKKGEYTQVGLFPGEYRIMAGKDGYAPNGIEKKIGIGEVSYLPEIKLADAKKVAEAAGGQAGGGHRPPLQQGRGPGEGREAGRGGGDLQGGHRQGPEHPRGAHKPRLHLPPEEGLGERRGFLQEGARAAAGVQRGHVGARCRVPRDRPDRQGQGAGRRRGR